MGLTKERLLSILHDLKLTTKIYILQNGIYDQIEECKTVAITENHGEVIVVLTGSAYKFPPAEKPSISP